MSTNLQTVIKAMEKAGARKTLFEFQNDAANTVAHALVLPSLSILDSDKFFTHYESLLKNEPVTFFEHSLPAIEGKGPGGGGRLLTDLWLIENSSVALQFAIVDRFVDDEIIAQRPLAYLTGPVFERFKRDTAAAVAAITADQKRILGLVARQTEFAVRKVTAGLVVVNFRSKIGSAALNSFFDEVIGFMRRYNRFELTEKTWRSMILKQQGIML